MNKTIFSFADLQFALHRNASGVSATLEMPNGVRVSCVFHDFSFGHREGLWESWATNIEPDPMPRSVHEINEWMAELSKLTPEQVKAGEAEMKSFHDYFENLKS